MPKWSLRAPLAPAAEPTPSGLVSKREAMRQLLGVRPIERLTKFAAVDLRLMTNQLLDLLGIVIPSLQMSRAELSFGIFFVAGTLPVFADFYLRRRRYCLFRH